MNKRKLGAAAGLIGLVALLIGFALPASRTAAQVGYGTNFTVDGNLAACGSGATSSGKPVFRGQGTPGADVIVRIDPGAVLVTTKVGSDGKYSATSPQTLTPGDYQVFVNNELVACIKALAPSAPATGNGLLDDAGGSGTLLVALIAALAIAGGVTLVARGRAK